MSLRPLLFESKPSLVVCWWLTAMGSNPAAFADADAAGESAQRYAARMVYLTEEDEGGLFGGTAPEPMGRTLKPPVLFMSRRQARADYALCAVRRVRAERAFSPPGVGHHLHQKCMRSVELTPGPLPQHVLLAKYTSNIVYRLFVSPHWQHQWRGGVCDVENTQTNLLFAAFSARTRAALLVRRV